MELVVKYEWPMSQLCLDCAHKSEDILENSAALCMVACMDNDGVDCSDFIENDQTEEGWA